MTNLRDPSNLIIMGWSDVEREPVDTAFLTVVYDLQYRREAGAKFHSEMLVVLQLGTVKHKYYSMIRQQDDDVWIKQAQKEKGLPRAPGVNSSYKLTEQELLVKATAGVDYLNSEIWSDLPTRTLKERMHDYNRRNLSHEYEELFPQFDWNFTTPTDTICGYVCFSATTTFRGRDWTVWYTPDIPVAAAPWKFNGLPGLVLGAADADEEYVWRCRGLSQEPTPIVYYEVDCHRLTREKWFRYQRQIHEYPLDMLGEGGRHGYYIQGERLTSEDHWTIPYNPIERE